ncbi:hypothetical protein HanRHA438_Chr04g0191381 [Helianthus annuus]|nr:hypothetical protein HanRHA438_Chr04g0191381 [Helianthus annuus]
MAGSRSHIDGLWWCLRWRTGGGGRRRRGMRRREVSGDRSSGELPENRSEHSHRSGCEEQQVELIHERGYRVPTWFRWGPLYSHKIFVTTFIVKIESNLAILGLTHLIRIYGVSKNYGGGIALEVVVVETNLDCVDVQTLWDGLKIWPFWVLRMVGNKLSSGCSDIVGCYTDGTVMVQPSIYITISF